MRLVVPLGGHLRLRRDQPPTAHNPRENIRRAAAPLARQAAAYVKVEAYPLDCTAASGGADTP